MDVRRLSWPTALLALSLMVLAPSANADFVTYQSGGDAFDFYADLEIAADESGDFSFGNSPIAVTGLQQFDPALGTLTSVSFAFFSGFVTTWNELFGDVGDETQPFVLQFEGTVQADLVYQTGFGGTVLVTSGSDVSLRCEGDAFDNCEDEITDNYELSGNSFPFPKPVSFFDSADLVGTGDITNLEISLALDGASFSEVDNVFAFFVEGGASLDTAGVEVTYGFTPVPVPAAVWLFGSALGLLGWIKRKAA